LIFLTVGLHTQGFERLVRKMDEIAASIEETVVMQIGHSSYMPKKAIWFRFTDSAEIHKLHKKARLIVTHAGAGCILTALSYRKPLIVVPRLKRFNEHVDNHQVQLAQELERQGLLAVVYDVDDLMPLVENANRTPRKRRSTTRNILINSLKKYINQEN